MTHPLDLLRQRLEAQCATTYQTLFPMNLLAAEIEALKSELALIEATEYTVENPELEASLDRALEDSEAGRGTEYEFALAHNRYVDDLMRRKGGLEERQRILDWLRARADRVQARASGVLDSNIPAPTATFRRLVAEVDTLLRAADDLDEGKEP